MCAGGGYSEMPSDAWINRNVPGGINIFRDLI